MTKKCVSRCEVALLGPRDTHLNFHHSSFVIRHSSFAIFPSPMPITLPPNSATLHTLANGLEVILLEDHANPLACVQLWVKAGSLHEEKWTGAGLAHLTEHMFFKGTEKRTAPQIAQEIQGRGGYVNAYTTFNRTVYWIDGVAEHVDGYLDVLADMARCS